MTAPAGGGHMDLTPLWLPLAIESAGINRQMQQVGTQAKRSFEKATSGLGQGMADGVVQAAQQAAKATRELDRATDTHEKKERAAADAADRHRVALAKLADVEGNAKAKAGQLAAAQAAVSTAQRKAEATAKDAARALDQQTRAAQQAETATKDLETAQHRTANAAPASGGRAAGFFDAIRSRARQAANEVRGAESAIEAAAGAAGDTGGSAAATGFMAGFGGQMAGGMGSMGESAAGAFGGSMVSGVAARIMAASGKAGPWGMAIGGLVALGAGVGAGLFNQVMAGAQREASQDVVQASLGVDDATMRRIASAAANSYTSVFGASIEENMGTAKSAIQAGLLPAGAGEGAMQSTIQGLDTIKTIMGAEIPEAARAAGQMMRTGMATDAQGAFDVIVRGTQLGLDKSGDWLDTLNEYSTQFRKLGIDGKTALGLINQMVQGGARDSDVAADALKEFSIRVVDNSELTKSAFAELGMPAEATAAAFGKGGKAAQQAMQDVLAGLTAIEDPVRRNLVGVALFGTQFEDLGNAAGAMNLDTAVASLGKVDGAATDAANTIGGNLPTSWEGFKRTFEVGLQSVQNSMAQAFGPELQRWVGAFNENKAGVQGFFYDVADVAVWFGGFMMNEFGSLINLMGQFGSAAGDIWGGVMKLASGAARLIGDDETADRWLEMAEGAYSWGEGLADLGTQIQNRSKDADKFRDSLRQQKEQMQASVGLTKELGGATAELKDGEVIIRDNIPEVLDKIDQTKWEVTHLPDGTVKVVPKTKEATDAVKRWKDAQGVKPADVPVRAVGPDGKPVRSMTDLMPWLDPNNPGNPGVNGAGDPFNIPDANTPGVQVGGAPPPGFPAPGARGGSDPFAGAPAPSSTPSVPIPGGGGIGPGGRPSPGSAFGAVSGQRAQALGMGGEAWRPYVRQALNALGPRYGITNMKAWEDALVRQIQSESSGNPGADNPNDSNGQGGQQHVSGLLQFLPSTYSAYNVTGRPHNDPLGQIAAAIPYVAEKWGMNPDGSPKQIGRGQGFAFGGKLAGGFVDDAGIVHGPGNGISDSIAGLVDGTRAVALSAKESINTAQSTRDNMPLINAMNKGFKAARVLGFAGGGSLDPDAAGVNPAIQHAADLAAGMGLDLTSGMKGREGQNSMHASGDAGDFSNGSAPTDEMLAFATMMAKQYGSQLDELIYDDPRWQHNIMDGKDVGPMDAPGGYTTAQAGDHSNHVHIGWKAAGAEAGPMNLGSGQLPGNGYGVQYAGSGGGGGVPFTPGPFGGAGSVVSGPGGVQIPLDYDQSQQYTEEQQQRAEAVEAASEQAAAAAEREADAIEARDEAQAALDEVRGRKNDIVAGTTAATPDEIEAAEKQLEQANRAVRDATKGVADANEGIADAQAELGKPSDVLKGAYESQQDKAQEAGPVNDDAKALGGGLVQGVLEGLGFDGSVFGDPTQWGIWKLFTGATNMVAGNLQKAQQGGGAGAGPAGGGGGGLFGGLLGGLFDGAGVGSLPGLAGPGSVSHGPGLSVPSAVSATAQPGSAVAPAAPGAPGYAGPLGPPPGPVGPNITINGNVGQAPEDVAGVIHQGEMRADRQPRVGFPGGAPAPVG